MKKYSKNKKYSKKYSFFSLLLIIICIFAAVSDCTESKGKNNKELNKTLKEESRQISEDYVKILESYKTYNLTEPVLN